MTSAPRLVLTALPGIPSIHPGQELAPVLWEGLQQAGISLQDGDVLALAQKIVSKAEGRLVDLQQVRPSPRARRLARRTRKDPRLVELILTESKQVLRSRRGLIVVEHRLGFICANAGIDRSNAPPGGEGEWVVLLPQDPDRSARRIQAALQQRSGARVGVLIVDSHGRPFRLGALGVAIGLAGVPGVVDLRGRPDLAGRHLRTTTYALADALSAAASLLMGEAAEGRPAVHLRGIPYPLGEGGLPDLLRARELDLFR